MRRGEWDNFEVGFVLVPSPCLLPPPPQLVCFFFFFFLLPETFQICVSAIFWTSEQIHTFLRYSNRLCYVRFLAEKAAKLFLNASVFYYCTFPHLILLVAVNSWSLIGTEAWSSLCLWYVIAIGRSNYWLLFQWDASWIPLLKIMSALQWEVVRVTFDLIGFSLLYFFSFFSRDCFFEMQSWKAPNCLYLLIGA